MQAWFVICIVDRLSGALRMPVLPITSAAAAFLMLCSLIMLHEPVRVECDQQQALIEVERHWLEAEDNASALESILADDFVQVLPFGFLTKAEQLRYMRSHPAPERGTARHFEDLRVRIFGSAGVVNGIDVASMPDGKVRKTIFTDAYRDGKWQAVNAEELPFNESARP
jgi:hypothetical protein